MSVQKFHTILAWLLLLLLILHLVMGSVTLLTPIFLVQGQFAYVFMGFVGVHAVLALWKVARRHSLGGLRAYCKANRTYCLRILSGLAVLVLALVHRNLWVIRTPFGVLLKDFEWPSLLAQLLLAAALAVHILLNIRPLLIDSGIDAAGRARKWMTVITVLLLGLSVVGAVAYFMGAMI